MRALRLLSVAAGLLALAAAAGSSRAERQSAPVPATAIAAGLGHTCALTRAGGVKCWGYNGHDELGDGGVGDSWTPVGVSGLGSGITQIAVGVRNSCALTSNGDVKCWGVNYSGALGDGTTERRLTPVAVAGLASGVKGIAAGNDDACVLTSAGGVKCWGDNFAGQLGDGTMDHRQTPTDVVGLTSGVTSIAASASTCALDVSGGVLCWGGGHLTPVAVSGLGAGATAITRHCALLSTGGVKCWGRDLVAADVPGLDHGVTAITSGIHDCALMTDGGVECWGLNDHGQLGDGTTTDSATPVDVKALDGRATAIAAGSFHTCAVIAGGSVECWGANESGQLGDGTTTERLRPVNVVGFGTAKATLAIVSRSVSVTRAHVAPVTLRCSQARCRGTVALTSRHATLGSRAFAIPAGAAQAVRVNLTQHGFALLVRTKRLSTTVKATGAASATRTVTLVAPP